MITPVRVSFLGVAWLVPTPCRLARAIRPVDAVRRATPPAQYRAKTGVDREGGFAPGVGRIVEEIVYVLMPTLDGN